MMQVWHVELRGHVRCWNFGLVMVVMEQMHLMLIVLMCAVHYRCVRVCVCVCISCVQLSWCGSVVHLQVQHMPLIGRALPQLSIIAIWNY